MSETEEHGPMTKCEVCPEAAKNKATHRLKVMGEEIAVCDLHSDEFDDSPMSVCEITGREKVEGSDGIERVPCDRCGSADESALERTEGVPLLLCSDCYDIITGLEPPGEQVTLADVVWPDDNRSDTGGE